MTDPDRLRDPGQRGVHELRPDVDAILGVHRPDERGMCAGCQAQWSLWVPFPCSHVEWAGAVDARIATLTVLGLPDVCPVLPADGTGHAG